MNIYYAKVALYAYANLEAIMDQIDELVLKKALSSMTNFKPCESQCKAILSLTDQKDILIDLKLTLDKILNKLTIDELDLLDYKYFKKKGKEYYATFDASSRGYFRRQIRVAKRFSDMLERAGYDDIRFEKEIFSIDFFNQLYKRVLEKESLSYKNKPLKLKCRADAKVISKIKNARQIISA